MEPADTYRCDQCNRSVDRADVVRTEPFADLDPEKWQTFCCPDCGQRLKTVFVALED